MAQARPLLFGAVLLTLVLPGHPLAPLSGLPLDLPPPWCSFCSRPVGDRTAGRPAPRGTARCVLVALALLKATVGWFAPAYGLTARTGPR
jgi:hypothetical protein